MTFAGTLLRLAIALWAISILLAIVGFIGDWSTLAAISFALRRAALAATILWAIFAAVGALWQRLFGRRGRRA